MGNLLIHIGYHKTGTSWLQDQLFANTSAGYYSVGGRQPAEAIQQFVIPSPFRFDLQIARSAFEAEIDKGANQGLVPVISHEGLSGNPIEGRYDSCIVADRLQEAFPDARILIGIREQKAMIFSAYRQYVRRDGTRSLTEFIGRGNERTGYAPIFRLDFLEFHLLIEYYQRLFRHVLVLPLELLTTDPAEYVCRIAAFAGERTCYSPSTERSNVGWSGLTLEVRRKLNAFFPRDKLGGRQSLGYRVSRSACAAIDKVVPDWAHQRLERRWKRQIAERVGEMYRDSNQRTSQLIGIDLSDFGYPC